MFSLFSSKFQQLSHALQKTRHILHEKLALLFAKPMDEKNLLELEQILYEADIGQSLVSYFIQKIQKFHLIHQNATSREYLQHLKTLIRDLLQEEETCFPTASSSPSLFFVVGANGSGKTTFLAKLAHFYQSEKKKFCL